MEETGVYGAAVLGSTSATAHRAASSCVLSPKGDGRGRGGKRANRLLGPIAHVAGRKIGALFASQKAVTFRTLDGRQRGRAR